MDIRRIFVSGAGARGNGVAETIELIDPKAAILLETPEIAQSTKMLDYYVNYVRTTGRRR